MKQHTNKQQTEKNNYPQANAGIPDRHFLYSLLFAGKITLKEYLRQLRLREEQNIAA